MNIPEFIAKALGQGLQQGSRYRVEFTLPRGVRGTEGLTNLTSRQGTIAQLHQQVNGQGKVNLLCHTATLPARQVMVTKHRQMNTPFDVPYSTDYMPVSAVFYGDSRLDVRRYFDAWQQAVVNIHSNTLNFADEFQANIKFFQLDREGKDVYGVELIDAYPTQIAPLEISYSNSEIINVSVVFTYRLWRQIL